MLDRRALVDGIHLHISKAMAASVRLEFTLGRKKLATFFLRCHSGEGQPPAACVFPEVDKEKH